MFSRQRKESQTEELWFRWETTLFTVRYSILDQWCVFLPFLLDSKLKLKDKSMPPQISFICLLGTVETGNRFESYCKVEFAFESHQSIATFKDCKWNFTSSCEVYKLWNNSYLNCGCRWKWRMSFAVNFPTEFKQRKRRSLRKSGLQRDLNPWPPRCSTSWAMKPHIGSEFNLLSSDLSCLNWKVNCDDHSYLQPQFKYELFHIYFTSFHSSREIWTR